MPAALNNDNENRSEAGNGALKILRHSRSLRTVICNRARTKIDPYSVFPFLFLLFFLLFQSRDAKCEWSQSCAADVPMAAKRQTFALFDHHLCSLIYICFLLLSLFPRKYLSRIISIAKYSLTSSQVYITPIRMFYIAFHLRWWANSGRLSERRLSSMIALDLRSSCPSAKCAEEDPAIYYN